MPFIRHTRDKRGYETTYVMHAYRPATGPQRTRVLYLFRSPSNVKLGRRALDDEAREALEHTHPDVSFDWTLLGRDSAAPQRPDPARDRPMKPRRSGAPHVAAPVPVPVVLEDQTLLGRVAGAEEAARLRARYAELIQRIFRRARTPEDRDRLTDRAHRLNPDDWSDEATVRSSLGQVEAGWDAILAELPSRRRGRRGGRRKGEVSTEMTGEDVIGGTHRPFIDGTTVSGIIEESDRGGDEEDDRPEIMAEAGGDRPSSATADRDGLGTGFGHPDLPGDR